MQYTLSALLAIALGLPVLAQGRPVPPTPPAPPAPPAAGPDTLRELQALTERLRAIEARVKAQQEGKKDGDKKPDGEKNVEVIVVDKSTGEVKKAAGGKDGPVRVIEMKKDGDKKPAGGKEDVIVVRVDVDEKKDGDKKPEGPRGFGGSFGGGFGFGPGGPSGPGGPGAPPAGGMMFLRMGEDFTPPGFDKLSKDEQAQFRKLVAKMRGGDQPKTEVRVREARREGGPEGGERRPEGDRRPLPPVERREGPDRKPNLEERMDRLERAIDEIRRTLPKK